MDDHRLDGNVLVQPAVARARLLDFMHHVHAFGHLSEDRVAVAVGARVFVIEQVVVRDVDEELRRGAVETTTLEHEAWYDAVKDQPVEKTFLHIAQKIVRTDRCFVGEYLCRKLARAGRKTDDRIYARWLGFRHNASGFRCCNPYYMIRSRMEANPRANPSASV